MMESSLFLNKHSPMMISPFLILKIWFRQATMEVQLQALLPLLLLQALAKILANSDTRHKYSYVDDPSCHDSAQLSFAT